MLDLPTPEGWKAELTIHPSLTPASKAAACLCCVVIMVEAGQGVVEITITDPAGNLVPNQVVTAEPGVLEVIYVPKVAGTHRASVVFNCEAVSGTYSMTRKHLMFNFIVETYVLGAVYVKRLIS